ncbi:MAG TPA: AAA family ATPase [Chitinophagaceae bacterium]|nr:AAA family ATPase [Chitinophagaceae bacterium]
MNKIDNIEIKNFKSIRHQKIEGCKKINVFIGYPNTGKSNILEALSLFCVNGEGFDLSRLVRFEKLTTFFYNGEVGERVQVIVNMRLRYFIENFSNFLRFTSEFDSGSLGFEVLDNNQGSSREKISSFEINDRSSQVYNFWRKNNTDLPEIKKYEFLKSVSLNDKSSNYSFLMFPNGNNLFNIISANPTLKKDINSLFEEYNLELLYESREQKFTILKRTDSGIFSIPYELVADTLQRLIFYKAAIASNKNSILLFEEPEAQMFPPYISKFTGSVWESETNQFFITTHSPYVINDFLENCKDELNIYIVNYVKGETKILKLTEENLDTIYNMGAESVFYNLEKFSIDENTIHT